MLKFKNLFIFDLITKEAKSVDFSPKMNIVTSETNSKGKSTIMKSLYHALGANSLYDDEFNISSKIIDLKFTFNDEPYRISRYQDDYLIFHNDEMINKILRGNITGLSKFYENTFKFSVYLKGRDKQIVLAPPAMSFLPYYLDQDKSWKKEVEPFEKLGQFEKLKRNDLFYYHLDILNKEYINQIQHIQDKKSELTKKQKTYNDKHEVYKNISETIKSNEQFFNVEEMEIVLAQLKKNISINLEKLATLKDKYYKLDSTRFQYEIERKDLQNVIKSITSGKDNCNNTKIKCPNCNEIFEVDLEEQIEDLYNIKFLQARIDSLSHDILAVTNSLSEVKIEMTNQISEINNLEKNVKTNEQLYKSYINRKAYSNLIDEIIKTLTELNIDIQTLEHEISEAEQNVDRHLNLKREAHEVFINEYTGYLRNLNVTNFDSGKITPFRKLRIGGSQYVRSTLAFFYAFLSTKKRLEINKFVFPLVIDSPREGEQDQDNSQGILEFILETNYDNNQLIVSTVNAEEFIELENYNSLNVIMLKNDKYHLLSNKEYLENEDRILELKAGFDLKR